VGLAVAGANRHDMKLTRETLESMPPIIGAKRDEFLFGPLEVESVESRESVDLEAELARVQDPDWEPDLEAPCPASGLCLDAGFDSDEVREVAAEFGYTTHIVSRGKEKQAKVAGQKARRWVVERTHSWLNRYRRLLIRWEKKAQNYLALLHLACAHMTWNKCLFG
jgi:transposase